MVGLSDQTSNQIWDELEDWDSALKPLEGAVTLSKRFPELTS